MLAPSFPQRLISVAAFFAAGLAACAGPGTGPTPLVAPELAESDPTPAPTPDLRPATAVPGAISLWLSWKPAAIRELNQQIELFQTRNSNVSFVVSYVPPEDLRLAMDAADAAGTLPSVVLAPSTWGAELLEAGIVQDISTRPTDEFRVLVHPLAWRQAMVQDQVVGVPIQMYGNVLFRNRELVAVSASTLEGLVEKSQEFRGTQNVGFAQDLGLPNSVPFAIACGGELIVSDAAPDLESPLAPCWLELLQSLAPAGPVSFNSDDDRALFEAGQAAWLIESTESFDDLNSALGETGLSVDPWPIYDLTGEPLAGYVWSENAYFSSGLSRDELDLAWEFVRFLLSADAQLALSNPNGAANIPVHISTPPLPGHVGQMHAALLEGSALPTVPLQEEYLDLLERAVRAVSTQGTPVDLALQRALDELVVVPDV